MTTVLAHGGGAPEAAMIGLPLLLFAVFFLLERRARKAEAADPEACDGTTMGTP
ncbi:MAG: hypothetical protein JWM62_2256 [Frankiales bacterium]|jgi:hypothetical protein|nr:hypothetical protein [Frankiales bacterium]